MWQFKSQNLLIFASSILFDMHFKIADVIQYHKRNWQGDPKLYILFGIVMFRSTVQYLQKCLKKSKYFHHLLCNHMPLTSRMKCIVYVNKHTIQSQVIQMTERQIDYANWQNECRNSYTYLSFRSIHHCHLSRSLSFFL